MKTLKNGKICPYANLSLSPPMMGLAMNWRKEKMEPRKPPNSTVLNSTGAPTLARNQSTLFSSAANRPLLSFSL